MKSHVGLNTFVPFDGIPKDMDCLGYNFSSINNKAGTACRTFIPGMFHAGDGGKCRIGLPSVVNKNLYKPPQKISTALFLVTLVSCPVFHDNYCKNTIRYNIRRIKLYKYNPEIGLI